MIMPLKLLHLLDDVCHLLEMNKFVFIKVHQVVIAWCNSQDTRPQIVKYYSVFNFATSVQGLGHCQIVEVSEG